MNNVTQVTNNKDCCGCGACYNKCPMNAISITTNNEGFYTPSIDFDKCINCGLCLKACPSTSRANNNSQSPACYAAIASNEIRLKSSSGGIFTLISEYILNKNGYICGAELKSDWSVEHTIINTIEDLEKLKKSKYVQSNTKLCFRSIKELLEKNNHVLFVGTPCQVAGLKSFLAKDFDKLYTIDIFCNGAPSPKLWQKYLEEEFNDETIMSIDFRDKKNIGWSCSKVTIKTDKSTYVTDDFTKGFHASLVNNTTCGDCKFSKYPRQGDLSLGDFWGINNYDPNLNDNKGTSIILVNNQKGEFLLQNITPIVLKKITLTPQYNNGRLIHSKKEHKNRTLFFQKVKNTTVKKAINYGLTIATLNIDEDKYKKKKYLYKLKYNYYRFSLNFIPKKLHNKFFEKKMKYKKIIDCFESILNKKR